LQQSQQSGRKMTGLRRRGSLEQLLSWCIQHDYNYNWIRGLVPFCWHKVEFGTFDAKGIWETVGWTQFFIFFTQSA
jgi:hypothetical protein